jgi:tRNA (guanine-N7-)-methyltransferase
VGDAEPRLRRVGQHAALPISVQRPVTKYEAKQLAGPVITELIWEKR